MSDISNTRSQAVEASAHHAIRKIKDCLGLTELVSLTFDVACGIGRSSVVLKQIAERIVGADPLDLVP
jgi:hypothetical protein